MMARLRSLFRPAAPAAPGLVATVPRRDRLQVASRHLDTATEHMRALHDALDECWEHDTPAAYLAAQERLTALQHTVGRARAALAATVPAGGGA